MYANVWHRFITPTFFLMALLPLGVFLYIKLQKKFELKYLFLFEIVLLLLSYSFSSPANIVTFWLVILILTSSEVMRTPNKKTLIKNSLLLLLTFILWVLFNWFC